MHIWINLSTKFQLNLQLWCFEPNLPMVFLVKSRKIALVRGFMVVTYYIKLFCTGADQHNGILMSLLFLAAETIKQWQYQIDDFDVIWKYDPYLSNFLAVVKRFVDFMCNKQELISTRVPWFMARLILGYYCILARLRFFFWFILITKGLKGTAYKVAIIYGPVVICIWVSLFWN